MGPASVSGEGGGDRDLALGDGVSTSARVHRGLRSSEPNIHWRPPSLQSGGSQWRTTQAGHRCRSDVPPGRCDQPRLDPSERLFRMFLRPPPLASKPARTRQNPPKRSIRTLRPARET